MVSYTAQNIKRIIADKGLKQIYIADKAGYDRQVFNNMLNGRKLITDADIPRIANALGVEPNDLFKMPDAT